MCLSLSENYNIRIKYGYLTGAQGVPAGEFQETGTSELQPQGTNNLNELEGDYSEILHIRGETLRP